MKRLKFGLSLLLTVLIILSVFTALPMTTNAEEVNPQFIVDKVVAKKGDKSVAVNVSIKNNPGIASVALDINYDVNALTLTNFSYNTDALSGASVVPFNSTAKTPCLSVVNGSSNITGDFTLATLYFDVSDTATGSFDILLSYDEDNVYDINENNVAFDIVKGGVTVNESETTHQLSTEATESTAPNSETIESNTTETKATEDVEPETTKPINIDSPLFIIDSVTTEQGDNNVAVSVKLKNNPGIASIALDVHYNDEYLVLKKFTYNTEELKGASTVPFNEFAKPTCLTMVNGSENVTGDITFATLYFDVTNTPVGTYDISVTYDKDNVYDINENNVAFQIVSGSITVRELEPTKSTDEPVESNTNATMTDKPTESPTEKTTIYDSSEPTESVTDKPITPIETTPLSTDTTSPSTTEKKEIVPGFYLVGSEEVCGIEWGWEKPWEYGEPMKVSEDGEFWYQIATNVKATSTNETGNAKGYYEFKIVYVDEKGNITWHPGGVGNNTTVYVTEDNSTIVFKFYLLASSPKTEGVLPEMVNAYVFDPDKEVPDIETIGYNPIKPSTTDPEIQPTTQAPTSSSLSKIDISDFSIYGDPGFEFVYTGKPIRPNFYVYDEINDRPVLCTIEYYDNVNVGLGYAVFTAADRDYTGTTNVYFEILKAKQPMTIKAIAKKAKLKALRKHKVKVKKSLKVSKAKGKVTYKIVKSGTTKKIRKLVSINSKGVITIKKWKKAKKGTYKIKVRITAKGNSNYKSKSISRVIKVKIK